MRRAFLAGAMMMIGTVVKSAPVVGRAPEPAPLGEDDSGRRQLQAAGGACNGMMMEMQSIAASCCGSQMEYCGGATPSRCDDSCKPVFESFYSRCTDLITRDPNRAEYATFQGMCHPATDDTSEVLWSDDFESGLGKWRGKTDTTSPDTAVIDDDPDGAGNHALHVTSCHSGGDAYSKDAFQCSLDQPCLVSYVRQLPLSPPDSS